MQVLKNVSLSILIIILLSIGKLIVEKTGTDLKALLNNILSCLQGLLLGGVIFWLALYGLAKVLKKRQVSFVRSWLIYLAMVILAEIGCSWLLHNAHVAPKNIYSYLDQYYREYEMKIAERKPDCGCYDSTLIYTLKPSASCLYTNLEFSDSIYTNRLGLRDDNTSLEAPDIICMGDSYTMGWGVKQQEAFPQMLEQKTGLKVLNAGISSYGTAREIMLLKRLDTSNLKFLVIQFFFNDKPENATYIKNNYTLPVPTAAAYDSIMTVHKWRTAYFPLKHCLTLIRIAGKDITAQLRNSNHTENYWKKRYDTTYIHDAAKDFLDILYRSGINFSKTKILVADVNRYPLFDHHFIKKLDQILQTSPYPAEFKSSIRLLDLSALNDKKYFYHLDEHLNKEGHARLAEIIARELESLRARP